MASSEYLLGSAGKTESSLHCDADGQVQPFEGNTAIFITPGYRFCGIDGLMTNFYLPCSTLFTLVSARRGRKRMKDAYAYAIDHGYRFYSYGDASLLLPERMTRHPSG